MGTNYYHRVDCCDKCGRFNEHHIGKSSYGWTFTFHGQRQPGGLLGDTAVASYVDWLRRLSAEGKIADEYGTVISLEDFKGLVASKRTAPKNHTKYCLTSGNSGDRAHAEKNCWLDEEGNSFSEGEFS